VKNAKGRKTYAWKFTNGDYGGGGFNSHWQAMG